MKTFKQIDFWVSVGLIITFLIIILKTQVQSLVDENVLWAYVFIGSWHVISMLVHTVCHWFTQKWGTRFWYQSISFILLITIPVGSFWILAIAAPFMAVFYTAYCGYEVFVKMRQRPLAVLK